MPIQMHPETAVGELKAGAHKFPLQAVDVQGKIQGLLYSATVTQTFRNDRNERMEAVYIFPLPPKAAVHGFVLKIGDREVVGEIKERGQARREYRQAVQAGHRAALMEEERSDIFTTTVGNIGPGEEVSITFELSGPLSCFKNIARLRFPLVVGDVYVPGQALAGASVGAGAHLDTDQVPDASRLTPPRLAANSPNPVQLKVCFEVEPAGLTVSKVESTCHFARTKQFEDGRFRVSLLPGVERLDRAFVLEVTYPEDMLQTALTVDKERGAFALTVVPPTRREGKSYPRDVVILLDRSGSMGGWSMVAARRAAARIVESLNEDDSFGLIAFDHQTNHFDYSNGLKPANSFFKMRAAQFLGGIEAQGGTELLPALREGLDYFRRSDNRDPHMIIVTDGEVANDSTLIRACQQGVRISTIGIGVAAREGLLNRMADTSGGLCTLIPNEADLEKDLAEMHRRWGQPVWKALSLKGADEQFRSPKFWDVWQDVPTTFFGRLEVGKIGETTEVNGWLDSRGQHAVELKPTVTEDLTVYRAWARSRLLDLEDLFAVGQANPHEMVSLSVQAQVLCRFTAFSAVDKAEKVDMELKLQQAVQPVEQTTVRSQAKPSLARRQGLVKKEALGRMMSKPTLGGGRVLGGRGASFGAPPPPASPAPMRDELFSCESAAPSAFEPGFFGDDADAGLFDMAPEAEAVGLFLEQAPEPVAAPEPTPVAACATNPAIRAEAKKRVADTSLERARVAMNRLESLLQGDQFSRLLSEKAPELLATCLKNVKAMVDLLAEYLRTGPYPEDWSLSLRELLAKAMDYQEALEHANPGDLAEAVDARRQFEEALTQLLS